MAEDEPTTIKQLIDIYHSSRSRGEWVHLSLESKDGKDFLSFCGNRIVPLEYQQVHRSLGTQVHHHHVRADLHHGIISRREGRLLLN